MAYSLSRSESLNLEKNRVIPFGRDIANETRHSAGGEDALCPTITSRSPSFLELQTSPRCNHSEVMDRHLGPSHVLSSIIDRSERKK